MKKKTAIILLNWMANSLAGFYAFGRAFNDASFDYGHIAITVLCVSVILGIISGSILKNEKLPEIVREVLLSTIPLLAFLGLLVLGSLEQGGVKEIVVSSLIFAMPVILETVAWHLSVFAARRS